jgi:hypothetical protein
MNDLESRVTPYVSWLTSEITTGVEYHNHKEAMAWAATAGSLLVVGAVIGSPPPSVLTANRLVGLLIVVVATIAVLCFVSMQFERRWNASENIAGLRREITRVCCSSGQDGLSLPGIPAGRADGFAALAVGGRVGGGERNLRRILKAVLQVLLAWWTWPRINSRLRSEASSYILIVLAAAIAVRRVFGP